MVCMISRYDYLYILLYFQSFSMPPVKVKPSVPDSFKISEGSFGLNDLMTNGLTGATSEIECVHPIAASESSVSRTFSLEFKNSLSCKICYIKLNTIF